MVQANKLSLFLLYGTSHSGHSMGGKTAMLTALRQPSLVERLIVLDVSPRVAPGTDSTLHLLSTIQSLDLNQIHSRRQADIALREEIPVSMFFLRPHKSKR